MQGPVHMTERSRNIMVGLTTLGGLAALVILLLLFGYVPAWFAPGYVVKVEMADSQGINDASRVWLYGIDVGKVEKVELLPFPERGVKLTMQIRQEVNIPAGTVARVTAPLLGGTPSVALDTQQTELNEQTTFLAKDGSATLEQGSSVGGPMAQMAQMINERLDKYEKVVENIDALSQEWTAVARNLNQITTPRTPEEVDAGQAQGNIASVVARMDSRVKELATSIEAINKWAADEKLQEDVRLVAANARKLTEKMDSSLDQVNKVSDTANKNIERLTTRFIASADDLSGAIASVQKTIDEVREGKGSAGKFIGDPALYNNLNDSAQRIGKAADEIKLLLEKVRKEGIPVQF